MDVVGFYTGNGNHPLELQQFVQDDERRKERPNLSDKTRIQRLENALMVECCRWLGWPPQGRGATILRMRATRNLIPPYQPAVCRWRDLPEDCATFYDNFSAALKLWLLISLPPRVHFPHVFVLLLKVSRVDGIRTSWVMPASGTVGCRLLSTGRIFRIRRKMRLGFMGIGGAFSTLG